MRLCPITQTAAAAAPDWTGDGGNELMSGLWKQAVARFDNRSARVGVLGLGYAGLPLTCCFAEAGFETFGFDVDRSKIEQLRAGHSYIGHIPADRIARLVESRRLRPTADFSALRDCDAAIICVPTPLGEGRTPDLTFVVNTAEAVAENLHQGQLVVLESTTYPGTTDEVLPPLFERSGLRLGKTTFWRFRPNARIRPTPTTRPARSPKSWVALPRTAARLPSPHTAPWSSAWSRFHRRVPPRRPNCSRTSIDASTSR